MPQTSLWLGIFSASRAMGLALRLMASRVASRCYNRWNRGISLCYIPQRRGGLPLPPHRFSGSTVLRFSHAPPPRPHSHPVFSSFLLALTLTLRHDGIGRGILGASAAASCTATLEPEPESPILNPSPTRASMTPPGSQNRSGIHHSHLMEKEKVVTSGMWLWVYTVQGRLGSIYGSLSEL